MFSKEQLEQLETAIAEGTLIVRYADKSVQYRSLEDMLRLREVMRTEIGMNKKQTRFFAQHSKGTNDGKLD